MIPRLSMPLYSCSSSVRLAPQLDSNSRTVNLRHEQRGRPRMHLLTGCGRLGTPSRRMRRMRCRCSTGILATVPSDLRVFPVDYHELRRKLAASAVAVAPDQRITVADGLLDACFTRILAHAEALGFDADDKSKLTELREVALAGGDVETLLEDPYWEEFDVADLLGIVDLHTTMRSSDFRTGDAILTDLAEGVYGHLDWLGLDAAAAEVLSIMSASTNAEN